MNVYRKIWSVFPLYLSTKANAINQLNPVKMFPHAQVQLDEFGSLRDSNVNFNPLIGIHEDALNLSLHNLKNQASDEHAFQCAKLCLSASTWMISKGDEKFIHELQNIIELIKNNCMDTNDFLVDESINKLTIMASLHEKQHIFNMLVDLRGPVFHKDDFQLSSAITVENNISKIVQAIVKLPNKQFREVISNKENSFLMVDIEKNLLFVKQILVEHLMETVEKIEKNNFSSLDQPPFYTPVDSQCVINVERIITTETLNQFEKRIKTFERIGRNYDKLSARAQRKKQRKTSISFNKFALNMACLVISVAKVVLRTNNVIYVYRIYCLHEKHKFLVASLVFSHIFLMLDMKLNFGAHDFRTALKAFRLQIKKISFNFYCSSFLYIAVAAGLVYFSKFKINSENKEILNRQKQRLKIINDSKNKTKVMSHIRNFFTKENRLQDVKVLHAASSIFKFPTSQIHSAWGGMRVKKIKSVEKYSHVLAADLKDVRTANSIYAHTILEDGLQLYWTVTTTKNKIFDIKISEAMIVNGEAIINVDFNGNKIKFNFTSRVNKQIFDNAEPNQGIAWKNSWKNYLSKKLPEKLAREENPFIASRNEWGCIKKLVNRIGNYNIEFKPEMNPFISAFRIYGAISSDKNVDTIIFDSVEKHKK